MWQTVLYGSTKQVDKTIFPIHFTLSALTNRVSSSRNKQESSDVNILVVTGEIGRTGFRNELKHLWLHRGIFGNVSYPFWKINSYVWPYGCCHFDCVSSFKRYWARHHNVRAAVVWCNEIWSTSLLDCIHTVQLWMELLASWDQFFLSRPHWKHIACAIVPAIWA